MNHHLLKCVSVWNAVIELSFFISLTNIYAQQSELVLSNGEHVRLDNPNGGVSSVIIKDGKVQSVQKENPQEIETSDRDIQREILSSVSK